MAGGIVGRPVQLPTQPQLSKQPPGEVVPPGYRWDSVKGGYERTPSSMGTDRASQMSSMLQGLGISPNGGGGNPFDPTQQYSGSGGGSWLDSQGYKGGSGGGSNSTVQMNVGLQGGGPNAAPVAKIADVDNSVANAQEFARAKDQVGAIGRSALTGLRANLGGRGQLGSGNESKGVTNIIQSGQGELGNTVREQAITNSNQHNTNAGANYQGQIAQRGQDLAATQASNALAAQLAGQQYQGAIAQRGQDLGAQSDRGSQSLTARGQDMQNAQANRQYQLEQQKLRQAQYDKILGGLY